VAEPRDIRATADMIKILTVNESDKIDREWIEIVENEAYWSRTLGEIRPRPEGPCFTRLFDTVAGSKHIVKIPAFSPKQCQVLWDTYNNTLAKLEDKSAFEEEPYEFISVWAKRNHDVYLDIVRAIAYCFVKKKPVGSYVLVGLRRNGKSSFVGLLHTIFGEKNTSMLRLSQLGDPHYTKALTKTMLNAPDEEDEKSVDAQASFKTISDHGILNLGLMYKDDSEPVLCDFMSFYPMNHIPEWTGAGASACMKRTLVIPFYADLSKFDKSNYNFAEATFTADFMSGFIGYVLAFANYYTSHELEFSDTMRAAQESIEEELDSAVLYREKFEQFFDGFSTVKFLFDDYCNWCKSKDMTIRSRKEFKFVFREYMTNRRYYYPKGSAKRYPVYRIPSPNHTPMFEEMGKTEVGDVNFLHECGASLVERMETYYEERGWTPGGEK
jgi:phage/plasmid-associated DNA primase